MARTRRSKSKLDQLEQDVSDLKQGMADVKKLLGNHLAHHEMWMKYYFPALVGLANTALGYYIKLHTGH